MKTEIYSTGAGSLLGRSVYLSASKVSRDFNLFPIGKETDMDECIKSLARAVFAERGRLVIGAHPTISPLIVEVATEYFPPEWTAAPNERPVIIYQSEAFRDVIPEVTRQLEQLGYADIIPTKSQAGEKFNPETPLIEQCLKSLAHMRERMFEETLPIAMVAANGMQGVIREARLFLKMFAGNVYVSTSLGGASSRLVPYLADNILGEEMPGPAPGWQQRMIEIESVYGDPEWASMRESMPSLPTHPYAAMMQRAVQDIAKDSL